MNEMTIIDITMATVFALTGAAFVASFMFNRAADRAAKHIS